MNNLNNLSDDELDKLFRQSAEESDVEFDEGAWQKMNSLLEEKQPLRTNLRKYTLIILAILFLGSTAVYFGNENGLFNSYQNEKNIEEISKNNIEFSTKDSDIKENIEEKNPKRNLKEKDAKVPENESVNSIENNVLENGNSANISENTNLSNKTGNDIEKNNLGTIPNQPIDVSVNNKSKNKKKSALKSNEKIGENAELKNDNLTGNKDGLLESKTSKITKNDMSVKSKSKTNKPQNNKYNSVFSANVGLDNNKSTKSKALEKYSEIVDSQSIKLSEDVGKSEIEKTYLQNIGLDYLFSKTGYNYKKPKFEVEVIPLELDLPEPKEVEFYKKGLAIRLAISPDISRVSSNKVSKIGSNIGGLLEYRFSQKLSVQAGVFRSMKYYDAMPNQYTWVWGYSHDKLVDINAQCKMVDFPINIRYDFLAKGTTRIFVGAGATTYKMMSEKYRYNYLDKYSPTITHHDWEGKTGTYYSSNLNLSFGLEKYVSKNFTIQVEPFVKAPLKSIGFGKVPLVTYGMMISGKYPLNNLIKK